MLPPRTFPLLAEAGLMFFQSLRVGAIDDFARVSRLGIGAVGDQDIFAAFHRRLILQNAVLGDAHAVKSGAQRA